MRMNEQISSENMVRIPIDKISLSDGWTIDELWIGPDPFLADTYFIRARGTAAQEHPKYGAKFYSESIMAKNLWSDVEFDVIGYLVNIFEDNIEVLKQAIAEATKGE